MAGIPVRGVIPEAALWINKYGGALFDGEMTQRLHSRSQRITGGIFNRGGIERKRISSDLERIERELHQRVEVPQCNANVAKRIAAAVGQCEIGRDHGGRIQTFGKANLNCAEVLSADRIIRRIDAYDLRRNGVFHQVQRDRRRVVILPPVSVARI